MVFGLDMPAQPLKMILYLDIVLRTFNNPTYRHIFAITGYQFELTKRNWIDWFVEKQNVLMSSVAGV